MKFIGHRFAFAVAADFLAFAGKGDDAVEKRRRFTNENCKTFVDVFFDVMFIIFYIGWRFKFI